MPLIHAQPARPTWLLPSRPQVQVEKVIRMLEEAWNQSYETDWDVQDYVAELSLRQSGSNGDLENRLLTRFPLIYQSTSPVDIPYLNKPCHITDKASHILLWYFPKLISEDLQQLIWTQTENLRPKKKSNGSWRDQIHPNHGGKTTGIVNLSPGWFSQGHEGPADPLHPSSDIQQASNLIYLETLSFINAVISAIYSIIQPDLCESGFAVFDQLAEDGQQDEATSMALGVWGTPFTGLSVIINRETITHRDVKGYRESFDMLLTIGRYDQGQFYMSGLGFSLLYDPRTLVGLAGNVLPHGVCPVVSERACLAHFWHKKVGERLGVMPPQWQTIEKLTHTILAM
ncbi:uncharacterized protein LACBIDRAFT_312551 [Laccaria bicolor S238N-H82]|uniref:Predicted protein n=1 Tax=Laccaria bicolor (strain S238N-H82 / ATCC MYA-4686) TaxID=486041 RepID=B0DWD1_LACBS|nr:uncharacterized protein LACBIDRAFT_312548 [Laccaria bicolor S238N-H82]XP_001888286.1 uncharacterized protein LACBIDRAFT_312551 [Laccaria bicolor S238N-H82]EDR01065.1 predicted protein [Laccaria bicolor S238N-H82]EDR01067.1 predicted protein [Laccaria bicolor S238N-H82]|eukprot:XP_001888284.1 predicted protein [Laccaria bicolor S238N-H82]